MVRMLLETCFVGIYAWLIRRATYYRQSLDYVGHLPQLNPEHFMPFCLSLPNRATTITSRSGFEPGSISTRFQDIAAYICE